MRNSLRTAVCMWLAVPLSAWGSLLDPSDPYGFHSRSMATARATAPFARDFSATLSNPSGLAHEGANEVTLGYVFAAPALSMNGLAVESGANKMPLLGLRLNLAPMTKLDNDIAFGLAVGLDDNLRGLLSLSDGPAAEGQFVRQGRRQLLLSGGLGVEVLPKFRLGAGMLLSISANARMQFRTTLGGETSQEAMSMDVGPRFAPVLGLTVGPWNLGPVSGLSLAASYRGASWQRVQVEAEAEALLGSSPLTTLPLTMTFVDAYRPEEMTLGLQFAVGPVTSSLALDYSRWSRLGGVLASEDTVRAGAGLKFRNVLVPRLGAEVSLPENFVARAGYAYEATPLEDAPPSTLNVIDNSRHIFSLGAGYTLPAGSLLLTQPLTFDLAYQHQRLTDRALTLVAADSTSFASVAGGQIHALSFSLTLRF